eukprot:4844065-Pleurochrysis_carterae.AAC.1
MRRLLLAHAQATPCARSCLLARARAHLRVCAHARDTPARTSLVCSMPTHSMLARRIETRSARLVRFDDALQLVRHHHR